MNIIKNGALKTYIVLFLMILFIQVSHAGNKSSNQLNLSITLSGHILFGFGYTHWLDDNNTVGGTLYIIPEKGAPFGLNGGYAYFTNGERWRMKLGAELTLLVCPPDPDKRKILPMINFVPGVQYAINDENFVMSQLWLSYLPVKANVKFAPTGLEFIYGKRL
ncbi:MAG: hypothetical protein K8R79_10600 [Calditrichales bacterium]|nr:hypothetical protein [Calditrichales bacterium]